MPGQVERNSSGMKPARARFYDVNKFPPQQDTRPTTPCSIAQKRVKCLEKVEGLGEGKLTLDVAYKASLGANGLGG